MRKTGEGRQGLETDKKKGRLGDEKLRKVMHKEGWKRHE